ncbi:hypothetical protein B0I26_10623 [Anoxybacillus vitaminiphilus]|jgi:hypothetical protein|uniref:Uncharacterized protein n=1 Tax=Paranoxybacillus vitaminiphilus TaxID=581036 RepID=A0A327YEU3_9BACL|nr:hypothetical protein [Anoxybacillus vitaminiphilus]RAK19403.1 hypothetical protein B0I26_10623 [Anoxybacillus vitaminiphilus]
MKAEDIANAVIYMASAPKYMLIDEIVLHPSIHSKLSNCLIEQKRSGLMMISPSNGYHIETEGAVSFLSLPLFI